jgi:hypothetical protein
MFYAAQSARVADGIADLCRHEALYALFQKINQFNASHYRSLVLFLQCGS